MATATADVPGSVAVRLPSGRVRPRASTAAARRIIGVDGEGNDLDGRHAYTLLCAADDRGQVRRHIAHDGTRRAADDDRQANHGLPTRACLDFLLSLPESPHDLLLAFSFTYDAVKILSDLPLSNLRELAATETTDWEGYRIDFRPRKFFTVSLPRYGRIKVNGLDGMARPQMRRTVTVYDAFGYFQTSFVEALKAARKSGVFTPDELATISEIEEMKARRSQFENEDPARILAYCYSEVTMLAKMMRQVVVATEDMGIYPRSFHGSSAIASRWMRDRNITNRRGGYIADPGIPEAAVYGAYFGGRFESTHIGRLSDCHAYDINSAYPAVARSLPCLAHATARQVSEVEPGAIGVYLVGSHTSGPWAPFPIRIDGDTATAYTIPFDRGDRDLSDRLKALVKRQVLFAHGGRRWVWAPEVEAARRHFGADAIPVYDGWVIDVGCDHRPFTEIDDLYSQRRAYVKAGDGREKVIKLLVNSLYGKTAQHAGLDRAKGVTFADVTKAKRRAYEQGVPFDPVALGLVEPPDTLCVIWAGLITSGCRAQILDAIYRSGSVVSIATDGILSTAPIDGLACPDKVLGEWEYTPYGALSIYQNGVYTYTEAGEPKMKSRGFSPRDITAEMLSDAWDSGMWDVYPKADARGFIPLRQAMRRKNPLDLMGQWMPQNRPVSFTPSKRHFPPELWYGERPPTMATEAYTLGHEVMSLAYAPKTTWADVLEMSEFAGFDATDGDTPELD